MVGRGGWGEGRGVEVENRPRETTMDEGWCEARSEHPATCPRVRVADGYTTAACGGIDYQVW